VRRMVGGKPAPDVPCADAPCAERSGFGMHAPVAPGLPPTRLCLVAAAVLQHHLRRRQRSCSSVAWRRAPRRPVLHRGEGAAAFASSAVVSRRGLPSSAGAQPPPRRALSMVHTHESHTGLRLGARCLFLPIPCLWLELHTESQSAAHLVVAGGDGAWPAPAYGRSSSIYDNDDRCLACFCVCRFVDVPCL